VIEVLIELMKTPPGELLNFYGRSDCIIRERGGEALPYKSYLEIDLR
jgi:hypothetical protein